VRNRHRSRFFKRENAKTSHSFFFRMVTVSRHLSFHTLRFKYGIASEKTQGTRAYSNFFQFPRRCHGRLVYPTWFRTCESGFISTLVVDPRRSHFPAPVYPPSFSSKCGLLKSFQVWALEVLGRNGLSVFLSRFLSSSCQDHKAVTFFDIKPSIRCSVIYYRVIRLFKSSSSVFVLRFNMSGEEPLLPALDPVDLDDIIPAEAVEVVIDDDSLHDEGEANESDGDEHTDDAEVDFVGDRARFRNPSTPMRPSTAGSGPMESSESAVVASISPSNPIRQVRLSFVYS
jgi:hypothetical protein